MSPHSPVGSIFVPNVPAGIDFSNIICDSSARSLQDLPADINGSLYMCAGICRCLREPLIIIVGVL